MTKLAAQAGQGGNTPVHPSHLKFGKTPARPEAVAFKFSKYAVHSKLPTPPKTFGHEAVIPAKGWGMLGNDMVGNCVLANHMHLSTMWTRISKSCPDANFTTKNAIDAYSKITGYDPSKTDRNGNNPTDQGTDMKVAASYVRKTGLLDANGKPHKIAAYLSIDPTNLTEHYQAAYLFAGIGLGVQCPSNMIPQFDAGKPWSVVKGARVEGGHCIPFICRRANMGVVTWGALQGMTTGFFGKYNDESVAYVSEEELDNRKSPEGFDYEALLADLNSLK